MKRILLSAMLLLMTGMASAQSIVKGDMNNDGQVTVADVTSVVDVAVGNAPMETLSIGSSNPYEVDNSSLVGTWYAPDGSHFTLNADGTTDYPSSSTYKFMPSLGRLLFIDATGNPVKGMGVWEIMPDYLLLMNYAKGAITRYTSTEPVILVNDITLSHYTLTLDIYDNSTQTLSATVYPANAANAAVTWTSSNENVATVSSAGLVLAVGTGTCTITCTAQDGSGVSATCPVSVTALHEFVNLGLPSGTLWATCNIGATNPEDYGGYFAWGETVPGGGIDKSNATNYSYAGTYTKTQFADATYKYCNGEYRTLTKYCNDSSFGYNGFTDTLTELELEDDAAYVNWGSNWRMPSKEQFDELIDSTYTTTTWTTQNGVYGRLIKSNSNGNSIFLPAAGRRFSTDLYDAGSNAIYWARTHIDSPDINSVSEGAARCLYLYSDYMVCDYYDRSLGASVRPVRVSQ